jgi:hypothetical protein
MTRQGRDPREWTVEEPEAIQRFFASLCKHVLYVAGYGELGYEDEGRLRGIARHVLGSWNRDEILVHAGTLLRVGGPDGVAEIYGIARELGIETSGIHPSVAMDFAETHRVSLDCDHVFFVEDATWGGFLDGSDEPSPTLRLHLLVSDELVAIGGGKHAADELRAFAALGKRVRYFPAEMNYAFTRGWTKRAGVSIPDMRGAALDAWQDLERNRLDDNPHGEK